MATKTISNWVNRSLRSGHLVIGPVLFPAVSSRKRPVQAFRCSGIFLTRFNGCASEDKANNSLVKSTNSTAPPSFIYEHEAIQKPVSENNIGAPLAPQKEAP